MSDTLPENLEPALRDALLGRGYTSLTPVQQTVLDADAEHRDLRVTSQTGSGKTIAIGLAVRALVAKPTERPLSRAARPHALVIVPTRELGRQVEEELGWLFAPLGARVVALTGGASYRDEHRALAAQPALVVGTPGRLLDHLQNGSLDASALGAVAIDEADRMLDMGFAETLEAILAKVPETRRMHLVSATFPPEVKHLADRAQSNPLHLEGTRLGAANTDIEHVIHLVDPHERFDALVNVLLAHEGERTLVFARTRADVADLDASLSGAGFAVAALSGEMAQRERTRAMEAFKRGGLRILVATDVAARGIDVSDVTLVVHLEAPTDSDAYTHRSGRTGRAGRKGTSVVLVGPRELLRTERVLSRANVRARIQPMPTPEAITAGLDERLIERLAGESDVEIDPRTAHIARELAARGDAERTLARLLVDTGLTRGPMPRLIRIIAPPAPRAPRGAHPREGGRDGGREMARDMGRGRDMGRDVGRDARDGRAPRTMMPPAESGAPEFALFQVSFGARQGADPRRLLAIVCRRGDIESRDIGAIRIGPASSVVEVRADRAAHFAEAASQPDPRDPRVRFRPYEPERAGHTPPRAKGPRPGPRPARRG